MGVSGRLGIPALPLGVADSLRDGERTRRGHWSAAGTQHAQAQAAAPPGTPPVVRSATAPGVDSPQLCLRLLLLAPPLVRGAIAVTAPGTATTARHARQRGGTRAPTRARAAGGRGAGGARPTRCARSGRDQNHSTCCRRSRHRHSRP